MSAPKPHSVMTKPSGPTSFNAIWSATIDELPVCVSYVWIVGGGWWLYHDN